LASAVATIGAGTVTLQPESGVIVTVKSHEAELFPLSVAVQWTVVVPENESPELWSQETGALPLLSADVTLKVTVADPEPGELSNLAMFAGQLIVGLSVSLIVTVKVHVSPDSVEAVMTEVPIGNK
jgi:hypothetical protein